MNCLLIALIIFSYLMNIGLMIINGVAGVVQKLVNGREKSCGRG